VENRGRHPVAADMPVGWARAVALLEMVGAKAATELLKQLSRPELETLANAFSGMKKVSASDRRRLGEEALLEIQAEAAGSMDLMSFAHQVLGPLLGVGAADGLLRGLQSRRARHSLEWLSDESAEALARMLEEENPRTVAVVLASLRPGMAARVLSLLPEELRGEAIVQLATGKQPTAEAATRILEAVAGRILSADPKASPTSSEQMAQLNLGTAKLVEVFRQCDISTERAMLAQLEERAPELAAQVSQSIFSTIGDLRWLQARSLQIVLRQVEARDLAKALRGAGEEIRELCFNNLSENAAASLKEEIEALGPMPRRDVEAAQRAILGAVRDMIEQGRIQVEQEEELI